MHCGIRQAAGPVPRGGRQGRRSGSQGCMGWQGGQLQVVPVARQGGRALPQDHAFGQARGCYWCCLHGPWSLRLHTASGQACRGCWCTLATWHRQQPSQHAGTCRCSCTGLQVLTRALPRWARSRVPWWGAAFFLGAMCQVHRRASTRRAIRHQPAPLVQWTGPRSGSFPCANRGSTTLRIFAP